LPRAEKGEIIGYLRKIPNLKRAFAGKHGGKRG
jgi:hypothetical protein